jgi:hypothetical protein
MKATITVLLASTLGLLIAGAMTASAGSSSKPRDAAHIDQFGNLVIDRGGYRQIIVGGAATLAQAGITVDQLFDPVDAHNVTGRNRTEDEEPLVIRDGSPSIVTYEASGQSGGSVTIIRPPKRTASKSGRRIITGTCQNGVIVARGRSFMYGLDKNETPIFAGKCN